jgi:hypothetical protein
LAKSQEACSHRFIGLNRERAWNGDWSLAFNHNLPPAVVVGYLKPSIVKLDPVMVVDGHELRLNFVSQYCNQGTSSASIEEAWLQTKGHLNSKPELKLADWTLVLHIN